MVKLVVTTGFLNRVLDVGCRFGYTGSLIKEDGVTLVDGIEIKREAVQDARLRLDRVLKGSDEDESLLESLGFYVCIICADDLEYILNPWESVTLLKETIVSDDRLISSIPNERYFKVVLRILFLGEWVYQDTRILDRTHLRFFSRKSIKELFEKASYDIAIIPQKVGKVTTFVNFYAGNTQFFPMKFYVIVQSRQ